jgi:hypothetical protein
LQHQVICTLSPRIVVSAEMFPEALHDGHRAGTLKRTGLFGNWVSQSLPPLGDMWNGVTFKGSRRGAVGSVNVPESLGFPCFLPTRCSALKLCDR